MEPHGSSAASHATQFLVSALHRASALPPPRSPLESAVTALPIRLHADSRGGGDSRADDGKLADSACTFLRSGMLPVAQWAVECRSCAMPAVCRACAKSCHVGHVMAASSPRAGTLPERHVYCCCGAGPSCTASAAAAAARIAAYSLVTGVTGGTASTAAFDAAQRSILATLQWHLSAAMLDDVTAALDRVDDESGGVVAFEVLKLARIRDATAPEVTAISTVVRTLMRSPFMRFNKLHSERLRLAPRHPHVHAVLALAAPFVELSATTSSPGSDDGREHATSLEDAPLGRHALDAVMDPLVLALWAASAPVFERRPAERWPPPSPLSTRGGASPPLPVWVPRLVSTGRLRWLEGGETGAGRLRLRDERFIDVPGAEWRVMRGDTRGLEFVWPLAEGGGMDEEQADAPSFEFGVTDRYHPGIATARGDADDTATRWESAGVFYSAPQPPDVASPATAVGHTFFGGFSGVADSGGRDGCSNSSGAYPALVNGLLPHSNGAAVSADPRRRPPQPPQL